MSLKKSGNRLLLSFVAMLFSAFPAWVEAGNADLLLRERAIALGIVPLDKPAEYPAAMVTLGKSLFADPILSGNRNISCSVCHSIDSGTTDHLPLSIGEGGTGVGRARLLGKGEILPRNSPPLYNLGYPQVTRLFWDGRVSYSTTQNAFFTPEAGLNGPLPKYAAITAALKTPVAAQVIFPLVSHEEMMGKKGSNPIADSSDNYTAWELITRRVVSDSTYAALILSAFPETKLREINIGHLATALSAYMINDFSRWNTPWDRFLRGEAGAMDEREKKGAQVFLSDKAKCSRCHSGALLSDFDFHAGAFPQVGPGFGARQDDSGGYALNPPLSGPYMFRTPPLRNIALTAPYSHSGSYETLEDVVNHYNDPNTATAQYDGGFLKKYTGQYEQELFINMEESIRKLRLIFISTDLVSPPISLTKDEKADLVWFLKKSLTEE